MVLKEMKNNINISTRLILMKLQSTNRELIIGRNVLYICKMKLRMNRLQTQENWTKGKYLYKIGSTQNEPQRKRTLAHQFSSTPENMHTFEADKAKQLEKFVHTHLKEYNVKYELYAANETNHAKYSRETYLFTDYELNHFVLPFISKHHMRFRYSESTIDELKMLRTQVSYYKSLNGMSSKRKLREFALRKTGEESLPVFFGNEHKEVISPPPRDSINNLSMKCFPIQGLQTRKSSRVIPLGSVERAISEPSDRQLRYNDRCDKKTAMDASPHTVEVAAVNPSSRSVIRSVKKENKLGFIFGKEVLLTHKRFSKFKL